MSRASRSMRSTSDVHEQRVAAVQAAIDDMEKATAALAAREKAFAGSI